MKGSEYDLYASNRGDVYGSLVSEKNLSEMHLEQNCQFKA
jgi:hypothetical protein